MKITAIKQQEKRKDRYSIFIDGKYAFSLGESALIESRITSGKELDANQLKAYKKLSSDDKAYGNALRYAAMRPRSIGEMGDYFRRKQIEQPVADHILNKLSRVGLLDDAAFARSWVANRRLLKPTSRRKLALELQQKHVAPEIIDEVLVEDRNEVDERETLRKIVERKRARYADTRKFMAYLARQGYSYDDIKAVLDEEIDSRY